MFKHPGTDNVQEEKAATAEKSTRRVTESTSATKDLPTHNSSKNSLKETSSEPTLEDIYERRVSAPVAAHRCKARTYDLGYIPNTPISGSAFCGIHTKHGSLRHGRADNPALQ